LGGLVFEERVAFAYHEDGYVMHARAGPP